MHGGFIMQFPAIFLTPPCYHPSCAGEPHRRQLRTPRPPPTHPPIRSASTRPPSSGTAGKMRQKEVVTVAFAFLFAPVQGAISPSLALTTRVVAAHGPAVSAADIHHHHQPARSAQGKNHTDWVALSDWLATSSASSMTAHRFCLFVFFKRP